MASSKKSNRSGALHWARFLMAVLALLIAAAHLASSTGGSGGSGGAPTSHYQGSGSGTGNQVGGAAGGAGAFQMPSFNYMGFWFAIEIITYTIIAVVFLLGLRTWYLPSVAFNAFNVGIFFLSGVTAIPGITSFAFGNRLAVFSSFSTMSILVFCWLVFLVLGIAMLKYDRGSELDKQLVTKKAD